MSESSDAQKEARNATQQPEAPQIEAKRPSARPLHSYWNALLKLLNDGGLAPNVRLLPDDEVWPDAFPAHETTWEDQPVTAVQLPSRDQWLLVRPSFWQQVVATARSVRENLAQASGSAQASLSSERLRRQLASKLLRDGSMTDPDVARAILKVPRHLFLPQEPVERAYADDAIVTKHEGEVNLSSASQPAMVAIMLEQLGLQPGQHVLEVGAGTGYNAALMAELVGPSGHVTTVDIDQDIVDDARAHLNAAGYREVEPVCADGAAGYPPNAPYDRIILTVGASDIAPAWREQLADGGVLLLPFSVGGTEQSIAFRREGTVLRSLSARPCGFIKLRGLLATPELRVVSSDGSLLCVVLDAQGIDPNALRTTLDQSPYAQPLLAPRDMDSWWRWASFNLFCTLHGDRIVDVFDRDGRLDGQAEKHRHGLYDPTDNSLALLDFTAGRMLLLGGTGAGGRLRRCLAQFEAADFWQNRRLGIEAYPANTLVAAPANAWLLRRPFSDLLMRIG